MNKLVGFGIFVIALVSLVGCGGNGATPIRTPQTIAVQGVITFASTGKPAAGYVIEAWPVKDGPQPKGWDAEKSSATTIADGSYFIPGVPKGYKYIIQAGDTGRVWKGSSEPVAADANLLVDMKILD